MTTSQIPSTVVASHTPQSAHVIAGQADPWAFVETSLGEPVNPILGSPLFGTADFYDGAVSPDALFVYLSTRLHSLDSQINHIFTRQKSSEQVRTALREIQQELLQLPTTDDPNKPLDVPRYEDGTVMPIMENILARIEGLREIDPHLAETLLAKLSQKGGILYGGDNQYTGLELTASKQMLDDMGKDIEATAQLDMIRLQSLMSARQTAIQLATNLTASCADSLKSIVANVGR